MLIKIIMGKKFKSKIEGKGSSGGAQHSLKPFSGCLNSRTPT
jgi:hypothetical protein